MSEYFDVAPQVEWISGSDHSNHIMACLRQTPPLRPKLKELKMKLEPGHEWQLDIELGWKPEQKRRFKHRQQLEQRLGTEAGAIAGVGTNA